MNELIKRITEEIYENNVKPLCTHPETGEQCESQYSDAVDIVETVLKGLGMSNNADGKIDELKMASVPLIKYMCENHHPHVTAIVTPTSVELLEGQISIPKIYDYVVD